jgi:preprotein translocase subunit YajC
MTIGCLFTFLSRAEQAQRPQGSLITALIPFILVFVIFYLLIILPSRKKQKKHQYMVEQLRPGDRIITSGGIYGTVMGTQKDRVELKIAANVKIDVAKNAVAVILSPQQKEKTETH